VANPLVRFMVSVLLHERNKYPDVKRFLASDGKVVALQARYWQHPLSWEGTLQLNGGVK
jgi:hypothetical protein